MTTRKIGMILIITILFISMKICAQMGPPPGSYKMLNDKSTTTIPFKMVRNHIVITVQVNGSEDYEIVLDTGMPAHGALLHGGPKTDKLNLQFVGQAFIGGAGGSNQLKPASIAEGVSITLGDIQLTDQAVVVMPYDSTSVLQRSHSGVIGFALFSRFAVKLDFEKMEITLTESNKFQYSGDGEIIPLEMNRDVPYFYTDVVTHDGSRVPLKLVIDVGAGHALSLNLKSHDKLTLPENALKARLGTGVSGDVIGHVGRVNTIFLGKFQVKNVVSSMTDGSITGRPMAEEHGNLGTMTLKRFTVIFDYANKRMIVEPNSTLNDPFNYNMSGLQFVKENNSLFKIDRILKSSPAEKANIQINDWILQINGKSTKEFTYDDLYEMLKKEGTKIELLLKRGEKQIQTELVLERLI